MWWGISTPSTLLAVMKTKLELWLPSQAVALPDSIRAKETLAKLKGRFDVSINVLDREDKAAALKEEMLAPAVWHRIRFPQSRKGKNLYPVLLVRQGGSVVSFYPQRRGDEAISMAEFLDGLMSHQVRSLHPLPDEVGGLS